MRQWLLTLIFGIALSHPAAMAQSYSDSVREARLLKVLETQPFATLTFVNSGGMSTSWTVISLYEISENIRRLNPDWPNYMIRKFAYRRAFVVPAERPIRQSEVWATDDNCETLNRTVSELGSLSLSEVRLKQTLKPEPASPGESDGQIAFSVPSHPARIEFWIDRAGPYQHLSFTIWQPEMDHHPIVEWWQTTDADLDECWSDSLP